MIKKQILDRYACTPDNKLLLDITAGKVEDLYNNFDKHAPYVKKELNQDLVEYLIDSVSEIGKEDFVIQFHFNTPADTALTARIKMSVQNYFLYLKELELRELTSMKRTSFLLFAIGVVILFLSVWINQKIADYAVVFTLVFVEGLTVAAWVSLWNAIATFLINWAPHHRKIRMYERIANATILFHDGAQDT